MSDILELRDDLPAFRAALRAWLTANAPPAAEFERIVRADPTDYEAFQRRWMSALAGIGMATPHWPVEYGGAGLSLRHQMVVVDEMARIGARSPASSIFMIALHHVPGTLFAWGTPEQKARYLPGISRGEDVWCQGFSEPGAGSDLASLRTRAERDGDHYVVNGQKVWSSHSRYARYCILLARTDPKVKKHAGISYFLLDMRLPGVEVRPLKQATGRSEFSEIFLTDVRIPVQERVGEEGQGWQVAQSTLAAERGVLFYENAEHLRYRLEAVMRDALASDAAWLRDDQLRREFMALFAEQQALRRLGHRMLLADEATSGKHDITPALVKITMTELEQRAADLFVRAGGIDKQYLEPDGTNPLFDYIDSFGGTIAAGSNEIMRNIIAERGLGMPR
ncbi:MAG: acyl-CoA dehydrogenase family protein [Gammaproteobacteria bacterium]